MDKASCLDGLSLGQLLTGWRHACYNICLYLTLVILCLHLRGRTVSLVSLVLRALLGCPRVYCSGSDYQLGGIWAGSGPIGAGPPVCGRMCSGVLAVSSLQRREASEGCASL